MYYFNENQECDFVATEYSGKIFDTSLWELTSSNKDREIKD